MNRQQSQSAKHRRQKGLRRDNSVPVIVADPHPNLGGLGYPVWFRTTEIIMLLAIQHLLARHQFSILVFSETKSLSSWKQVAITSQVVFTPPIFAKHLEASCRIFRSKFCRKSGLRFISERMFNLKFFKPRKLP